MRSLAVQRDRFDIAPQLHSILHNTAFDFGWFTQTELDTLEGTVR